MKPFSTIYASNRDLYPLSQANTTLRPSPESHLSKRKVSDKARYFFHKKYNNRYIFILQLCLLFLFPVGLIAQSSVLDQYVAEGVQSNLALQQENQQLQQSVQDLKSAKSFFTPEVSFLADYTLANGGRDIIVPVGDLLNPVYASLNQLTDSQQFPQIENAEEQLFPNNFHDTRIGIRQPLFNTDIYYGYQAQKSLISVQEAKRDAYVRELTKEIKTSYYNYLKSQELLRIYDSTEVLLNELLRINQVLVKNNKATKDVVYSAQFELDDLESKVAEAERNQALAKSYFNFLLNRPLEEAIIVDTTITSEGAVTTDPTLTSSVNALQSQALAQREELNQLQSAIEANEAAIKLSKGAKVPDLSLGFFAGFQGFGYTFDEEQRYYLAQFQLAVPLFTGGRNNTRVQKATIEAARTRTQYEEVQAQIKVEVIEASRNLRAAQATVTAKTSALKSASERFKIIKRKYEENQALLVEYLDARTKFTNAATATAIARYDLLIRKAELERVAAL
ncbi:MAG: TolC family protein [Thermonemataceae bacterium]